ncbi:hypothetical protein EDB19DRAFT_1694898 [Suillus lakei]|nr:hypothetical protein EDB19DRAFT_1694898 [Suillus lakei]
MHSDLLEGIAVRLAFSYLCAVRLSPVSLLLLLQFAMALRAYLYPLSFIVQVARRIDDIRQDSRERRGRGCYAETSESHGGQVKASYLGSTSSQTDYYHLAMTCHSSLGFVRRLQ